MNTIATSQLSEGIYITREAFLDEKYILLSPEIPLNKALIERLEQWHFSEIRSEGDLTDTPSQSAAGPVAMEDAPLAAIDHGRRDGKEMQKAQKKYAAHLHFAEQLFGHYLQNGILQTNQIHEKIKLLLEDLKNQKQYLLRIPELSGVTVNYIVDHAVKTAIVAMATGASMKLPTHRLIELGTVGLLHEIGMIRLPSQLYMSNRELAPREKKAISTHPVLGFKILRQFDFPLQICLGVLECRENVDGSGYPRNLPANKISLYGKIMNAASTFAAMASPRPYRPAIDGHTIMKTLLTGVNTSYDNTVLQAMIGTFSLFPYGTYVQLASGHRAIVIDITPGKARAPKVQILTDPKGTVVREQPVTETENEQYTVTGVLSHQEVTRLKNAL